MAVFIHIAPANTGRLPILLVLVFRIRGFKSGFLCPTTECSSNGGPSFTSILEFSMSRLLLHGMQLKCVTKYGIEIFWAPLTVRCLKSYLSFRSYKICPKEDGRLSATTHHNGQLRIYCARIFGVPGCNVGSSRHQICLAILQVDTCYRPVPEDKVRSRWIRDDLSSCIAAQSPSTLLPRGEVNCLSLTAT